MARKKIVVTLTYDGDEEQIDDLVQAFENAIESHYAVSDYSIETEP